MKKTRERHPFWGGLGEETGFARELQGLDGGWQAESWPEEGIALLRTWGCWGAVVPEEFGGLSLTGVEQLTLYERVAAGSLALALILTQHDGACRLLQSPEQENESPKELLRACASGSRLATVGISQLTTSRQGGKPAMSARRDGAGYRLTGVMPWVTSAPHTDLIVVGAVLEDGQQLLGWVESPCEGLRVAQPFSLLALSHSATSPVHCTDLWLPQAQVLRGPAPKVLASRAPVKSLTVSAVGLGVLRALTDTIQTRCEQLSAQFSPYARLAQESYQDARDTLQSLLKALDETPDATQLDAQKQAYRIQINTALIQLATTAMTLAKGSGFVMSHPAQKLLREAMFFLVWSAPEQIQLGTLQGLWHGVSGEEV